MMVGTETVQSPSWSGYIDLYHGTLEIYRDPLLAGIRLDESRNRLDFGPGFYMTSNRGQAMHWGKVCADLKKRETGKTHQSLLVRSRFGFSSLDMDRELRILAFVNPDQANGFWPFVFGNRSPTRRKTPNQAYDIVIGPVARSFEPASPSAWGGYDQYSFHTKAGIDALSPLEVDDGN